MERTLMASPWLRAFKRAERAAGDPLERLAESPAAIEAMIRTAGLRRGVELRAERVLRFYLHLFNMPALSDVRRLTQQVAYLERRVRELSREADAPPPGDGLHRETRRRDRSA
jgi:hypothetical protein